MKSLDRESRRLIEEVRAKDLPPRGAELRNWQGLATKLNAPLTPTAAAANAALSAKTATGILAGVTGKVVVSVAIAAAVGGAGVYASRAWTAETEPSRVVAAVESQRPVSAEAQATRAPQGSSAPVVGETSRSDAQSNTTGTPAQPTVAAQPSAPAQPTAAAQPISATQPSAASQPPAASQPTAAAQPRPAAASSLREESLLIERAQTALAAGKPVRALALLDQHTARFPNGALMEERAAVRILALCASGRSTQAAAERAAFEARWPDSMLAERVRTACALSR